MGGKVYKYYSFDDLEYWRNPFQGTLHLSEWAKFNDPYEFYFKFRQNDDPTVIKNFLHQNFPEIEAQLLAGGPAAFAEWNQNLNAEFAQQTVRDIYKKIRMACFSKAPDILLMWSHYAKGHSGFCVEYDAAKLRRSAEGLAGVGWVEVEYVDEIPAIDFFVANEQGLEREDYFKYKSKVWSYEEEVRIYGYANSVQFTPDCVTGLYLGLNAVGHAPDSVEAHNLQELKTLTEHYLPHVRQRIHVATRNKQSFGIELPVQDFASVR